MGVRFGPAGNPPSFYQTGHKSSLQMPAWLNELGLTAYEYQCVRGVNIGENTARRLGEEARRNNIDLSIHAPYYITLGTSDPELRKKSKMHMLKSISAAGWMGAKVVVFHPGSVKKGNRADAMKRAKDLLLEIMEETSGTEFIGIKIAPETTGKPSLLGNLEEVLEFCRLDSRVVPAVDFGHLHAASAGAFTEKKVFASVLDHIEEMLGISIVQNLHIHFSPVEFTKAGERKHLTTLVAGAGPVFTPLAELIVERKMKPTIICESYDRQVEDALVFKDILEKTLT